MTRPVISSFLRQNDVRKIGAQRKRQPSTQYFRTGLHETRTNCAHRSSKRSIGKRRQPCSPQPRTDDYGARFGPQISKINGPQGVPLQDQPNRLQNRQLLSDDLTVHSMLLNGCGNSSIPSVKKRKTWSALSQKVNTNSTPTPAGPGKGGEAATAPSTLIPLNEARCLSSFDLVLQRSSSRLRKARSTCTRQPNPSKLENRTEEVLNGNINREAGLPQYNSRSPLASEAFVDGQYVSPVRQGRPDDQQAAEQTKGTGELSINRCAREYRFTIDEQVELELRSNTTGTLCSDPTETRMRSAGSSHVSRQEGIAPVGMATGPYGDASYACIAPELASTRYDIQRRQVYTSDLEERATKSFSASLRPHAEATDFSFATCHDSDSEDWLGCIFPDNMRQGQSEFTFGSAPQICPRDQNKNSPHLRPANNTNEPTNLLHQPGSSTIIQPLDTASNFPSMRNSTIFTPGPSVSCSKPEFLAQASPMECYFDKRVENTSMYNSIAGDEFSSGILPTENIWDKIEKCNTPFPTQGQRNVPPKRKASNLSEPDCFVQRPPRTFEPRKKQRTTHEYTLAFSPPVALPNIWTNMIASNHVQLWPAGSNSKQINDCSSMSMASSH